MLVAPVYDPAHGVYHTHREAHLAMPGGQYVNGHAVSRDQTFWARMPVSLWNDRAYDAGDLHGLGDPSSTASASRA